jgi:hypothetical protein
MDVAVAGFPAFHKSAEDWLIFNAVHGSAESAVICSTQEPEIMDSILN